MEQLRELKLSGMASSYNSQLELPLNQQLETHELIGHMVQAEALHRSNEKTATYLKLAKLRLPATIEQNRMLCRKRSHQTTTFFAYGRKLH